MSRNTISNSDDLIDSRDVIARIDELESDLNDAHSKCGKADDLPFEDWLREIAEDDTDTLQDDARELLALLDLRDGAEGYASDWRHGATLIRDSYFEDYARELAEDTGATSRDVQWPHTCIDWAKAAEELQQDYTSCEFDDVTYWVRS